MGDNDDESWEAAAQAALKIHRRVASAVRDDRDRDTTGTKSRKVRPSKKATPGSRLDGKTRPMSAPPGGFQGRSSYNSNHRTPPTMLVPSLEGIPTSSISLAELDACATLTRNFEESGSPLGASDNHHTVFLGQSSSSAEIISNRHRRRRRRPISSSMPPENHDDKNQLAHTRDYTSTAVAVGPTSIQPKKSKMPPQLDLLFDRLQRLGPEATCGRQGPHGASPGTASSTALMMTSAGTDSHIAARHRPASADGGGPRARDLDGCRVALADHLAARKRENELGRSDVSVRFLREHAKKTLDEDNTFVRALRAEVKAMEDIQLESIQRATQRCRDIGANFSYLPHRVRGKLHVLKVENYGGAKGQGDDEAGAAADPTGTFHSCGKVLSIEAFMKEDFSRLKKEPSLRSRDGAVGKSNKARPTSSASLLKEKQKKEEPGKLIMKGRPSAAETCRDLHQLIRDTAGLVETLTQQAAELEGQGWNR